MTKMDWGVIGIVLASIASLSFGAIVLKSSFKHKTSPFELDREHQNHASPARHHVQQQRSNDMEQGLQVDGPLAILKNTSDIQILFSRSETTNLKSFNRSEQIPEIHY